MTDKQERTRDRLRDLSAEVVAEFGFAAGEVSLERLAGPVADLSDQLTDAVLSPSEIEDALSGRSLPEVGTLDVDAEAATARAIEAADQTVQVDEAATVAIEGSGEAAEVLVETGGEVVRVGVENGGEVAAEVVAEVVIGALEV